MNSKTNAEGRKHVAFEFLNVYSSQGAYSAKGKPLKGFDDLIHILGELILNEYS